MVHDILFQRGSGAMQTGWLNRGGTRTIWTGSGAMATGWINLEEPGITWNPAMVEVKKLKLVSGEWCMVLFQWKRSDADRLAESWRKLGII